MLAQRRSSRSGLRVQSPAEELYLIPRHRRHRCHWVAEAASSEKDCEYDSKRKQNNPAHGCLHKLPYRCYQVPHGDLQLVSHKSTATPCRQFQKLPHNQYTQTQLWRGIALGSSSGGTTRSCPTRISVRRLLRHFATRTGPGERPDAKHSSPVSLDRQRGPPLIRTKRGKMDAILPSAGLP